MKQLINNRKLWLMASLTLGLAPFLPEPHLFGKIRWIMGGAVGMKPMDWFDFVLHGTPWVLLIRALTVTFLWKKAPIKSRKQ
ncbi:hypothetical protein [Runella slithyformis]|uniref:RND transporter n=1 Tax=Runella slithyformis (strain ATCC 29530 / DSM 19594 / LMG 11500 / NCIMB 11436 / LSU 4) TaxID=761193 RepID=A0A7U3ZRT5_RUNSL|nr:hypothetical protein [Runella slithyformis]AEI52195.1 hypothetical protein Runsl_5785 [Runella slithyformis DSM 19594]